MSTHCAVAAGTAKPMPCAMAMMAVLMPATRPRASTSGPPELPGFSEAVCCTTPSMRRPWRLRSERPRALTTPADTVDSKPNGLPTATTSCPARSCCPAVELCVGQRAGLGAQHGKISGRVAPGDHGRHAAPVDERHPRLAHLLHDVLVGQQVAVRGHHHAGARAAACLLGLGRRPDVDAHHRGTDLLDRAHDGGRVGIQRLAAGSAKLPLPASVQAWGPAAGELKG